MAKIRRSIEINAPPEKVFAFLDNPENFPKLEIGIKDVKIISKKKRGIGTIAHFVNEVAGLKFESDMETVKRIENKLFAVKAISGMKLKISEKLERVNGKTRVVWDLDYEMPYSFFGKMTDKLFKRIAEKQAEEFLKNLKKILEK